MKRYLSIVNILNFRLDQLALYVTIST